MGVHGLTTFLRESKRLLAKTHEFSGKQGPRTPFVVDGWSFIYDLHIHGNLPWVYGGEYAEYAELVKTVVRAWISVGIKIYFVFDGPCPQIKFQTQISRQTQSHIQPALLFFRTSAVSRSTSRFLHEARIIPPLYYAACIRALEELIATSANGSLEVHYADEEGDPYAVELAGRIGGYVVGLDSDYAVLNTDGYRGYVPLDEMLWTAPPELVDRNDGQDGDDFQPVRSGKKKKVTTMGARAGRGIIPPDSTNLTLSFSAYQPDALADHLDIPATLLPLLGALVGNDFTNQSSSPRAQPPFFDRSQTPSQRIIHVARTLQTVLSTASSRKPKQQDQLGSVMDLIDRTVSTLLSRTSTTLSTGEIDAIVERVVESALQYAIPKYETPPEGGKALWPTAACALHGPDMCPLLPLFNCRADESETGEALRALYVTAYRAGRLAPKVVDVLGSGTSWPRLFLESPDVESVGRSIGGPIRKWGYAVLEAGVGLPDRPLDEEDEKKTDVDGAEDEEDELVDVVESDSEEEEEEDLLAPLRGQLQRLHTAEGSAEGESTTSSQANKPARQRSVVEYVRRGTRVVPEDVLIPSLKDLGLDLHNAAKPLQLQPEEDRLSFLLHILHSDVPSVKALPPDELVFVLALRWVAWVLHTRARDGEGSKEREKERWTQTEARAFLASLVPNAVPPDTPPPTHDRNIQLVAQLLTALESIEHIVQILLLVDRVPIPVERLSGRRVHACLARGEPSGVSSELWNACVDGLQEAYGEERRRKAKKATSQVAAGNGQRKAAGLFGILADAEA